MSTDFQPQDEQDVREAIESAREQRVRRRVDESNRTVQAVVRGLIQEVEDARAGESEYDPRELLATLHWLLWNDPELSEHLDPDADTLDDRTKQALRRCHRQRRAGQHPPPAVEHAALAEAAKAMEYIHAVTDKSRYAAVRLSRLDIPGGATSTPGEITPIGRKRIGRDQTLDEATAEPVIDHEDCEHILIIALPRKGKDNLAVTIAGNLKDDHGYKWWSIFDDGRNETPMVAIPNDDPQVRENLDRFGQEPKAYETAVFVPATSGLPDELPANFVPFTIGIDDLDPKLVLQIAGIDTTDANTLRRVGKALEEAKADGTVETLVTKLKEYADELEATIEVREIEDDPIETVQDDDDEYQQVADADEVEQSGGEVREAHYAMDADDALEECADALMMLAGEGLIADAGAETNVDIEAEFRRDRVAVLNCNFLEDRNEVLKWLLTNLWLRLIFRTRDENPRLPRAVLETRELKNLAPSKLGQSDFKREKKALRNTFYEIATQGGSRRVLLIGSTQKLTEVSKAIRTNMPVKVLLQLENEEIHSLDKSYNFSDDQISELKEFDVGWGMLLAHGDHHWPIQWRGARCGLGLGDEHWLDRYAKAWGARVRQFEGDGWVREHRHRNAWVDVQSGEVHNLDVDTGDLPDLGQWHLFTDDLPDEHSDAQPGETIDEFVIEQALERRREYENPNDLMLEDVEVGAERTLSFQSGDEAETQRRKRLIDEYGIPPELGPWLGHDPSKIDRMLEVLGVIRRDENGHLTSQQELADETGRSDATISNYLNDPSDLGQCVEKRGGTFELTEVGREAFTVDWKDVQSEI